MSNTFVDVSQLRHAYLAGIIDGEGSISLLHPQSGIFGYPQVTITQKHKAFLDSLLEEYPGGSIYSTNGACVLTYRKSSIICGILTVVLPYLRLKQELATIMVVICQNMPQQKSIIQTDQQKLVRKRLEQLFYEAVERRKADALLEIE